ncbi:DUF6894 family protein [Glacieibacterium frigidum]|uniref:DUF6894 domain-containing protein n=1 Tax=Glacieibacterium frigidum TaxID=2593303 RepID=A0A552UJ37_9SPHN|nr:hypothetical protein [Glacieibacterium frigidum]TRW18242.1 hypothetical protein FMM06_09135 [Glacieibacterium frigidum]
MATYFIHSSLGAQTIEDPEGLDFDGLEDARQYAIGAGRHIVAEEIIEGATSVDLQLYIENEGGERLATVSFAVRVGHP